MYSLEDLGVVKDMDYSAPAAIDSQGWVTGTAYKGEESCAFYYDYGQKIMEDAGGLNSPVSPLTRWASTLSKHGSWWETPSLWFQWNLEATLPCSKVES